MWHPNIDKNGKIHLNIISQSADNKEKWTHQHSLKSILDSVEQILQIPSLESAINVEAANLFRYDPENYNIIAKEINLDP